jgi:hypothetical protein
MFSDRYAMKHLSIISVVSRYVPSEAKAEAEEKVDHPFHN